MEERLQKILARAGFGSRRASEELIAAGRVTVNGHQAGLGDKADPERDRILVDGRLIKLAEALIYIALYKPRGVISAVTSPDPRQTVRDLVDVPGQLYPVGRLDVDSEGLILMTNDGELANRLTHPRYGHDKEYRVLVARRPDEEQLETWRRGVVLEDGYRTAPVDVRVEAPFGKGTWLRVVMREGRKRQIRETGTQIGLPVVRIIRMRIGTLPLGNLKPREWRHLTAQEVDELKGKRPLTASRISSQPTSSSAHPQRKGAATPGSRYPGSAGSGKPPQKPGRLQGAKPGKSTHKPSRPKRPASSTQRTGRPASHSSEKGKRK